MVPDPTKACVGLEYFCFQGDELWEMDDEKLVQLGMRELEELGLARRDQLEFGFVERVPKAYPIYDAEYAERVSMIRSWLDGLDNFIQVGRNGLHRYNNSDHSISHDAACNLVGQEPTSGRSRRVGVPEEGKETISPSRVPRHRGD